MRYTFRSLLVIFIIIGLLMPSISTAALLPSSLISSATDCAKMAFIKMAADALAKRIREFLSSRIIGTITDLTGLGSVPVKDDKTRSATSATAREMQELTKKEEIEDIIARCLARYALDSEILGILKVAREQGRDGGATFVRNWRNFITSAEYRGEGIFRAILAGTKLCDYMEDDIWNIFGVIKSDLLPLPGQNLRVGELDPFRLRQQCTMPDDFSLLELQSDFEEGGGWAAIALMTKPENNPYWTFLQTYEELELQRALEKQADLEQVQANSGYIGISGKTSRASCLVKGVNGKCLIYKDIQTPGSYIAAALQASIDQELGWFTSSDELEEVLLSVFNRLTKRLGNLLKPESRPKYGAGPASPLACRDPSIPTPVPTAFTPWEWGTQGRTDRERVLIDTVAEIERIIADILIGYLDEWITNPTIFAMMNIGLIKIGATQSLMDELKDAIGEYILDQQFHHGENIDTLRSKIYAILLRIVDLVLKVRYELAVQNNSTNLETNRTDFLNIFPAIDQAEAIDIINTFDIAAKELTTGINPSETPTEDLPLCEPTPTNGGGGGNGGGGNGGDDGDTWWHGDSFCRSLPSSEYDHLDDLRSVQEAIEGEARNGTGAGARLLDPNDIDGNNNYRILTSFDEYIGEVISRMQARGYNARNGGEEIEFYLPGEDHDEGNDIGTAQGYVRKAREGSSCTPPRF